MAFFETVKDFIRENEADERLKAGFLDPLKAASKDLQAAATFFLDNVKTPNAVLAGSTDFLHLFGHVCLGYLWARMAKAAARRHGDDFSAAKLATGRYYMARQLPATALHLARIQSGAEPVHGPVRGGVLMPEYKLHCFAQSGNSYKVALMLALNDADWEPVWVDFFNGATRTPEYLELNVMGEVPILEHGELRAQPSPASSSTTSPSATATSARSPRRSAARSCAGRCGTTTSSPPTSPACAS